MSVGQDRYLGIVALGSAINAPILTRDTSNSPSDSDAAPTYRVYGPNGVMQNGVGTLTPHENGFISGATNATPIVITSAGHGLSTGMKVTVGGVTGNTAANGTWVIQVVDADHFSLVGSVGTGAYVSGGGWHTTGLYNLNVVPTGGEGYQPGFTYSVLVTYSMGGAVVGDVYSFTVV